MALTAAQNATLKAAINADPTLSAYPNTPDGSQDMCNQQLNLNAIPSYICWKPLVAINATGEVFDGTEWAGMTAANISRLSCVAAYLVQGYNASRADVREMFNDVWSGAGGQITRTNLLAFWKRSAWLGEKILKTIGAGTDADPATLGYVGALSGSDVQTARNS